MVMDVTGWLNVVTRRAQHESREDNSVLLIISQWACAFVLPALSTVIFILLSLGEVCAASVYIRSFRLKRKNRAQKGASALN